MTTRRESYMQRVKAQATAAAESLLAGMSTVLEYLGDEPLGYEQPDSLEAMVWFLSWCDDTAHANTLIEQKMALKNWDREAGEAWMMNLSTDFCKAIEEKGGPDAVRYEQFLEDLTEDRRHIKAAMEIVFDRPKAIILPPQPPPDPLNVLTMGLEGVS